MEEILPCPFCGSKPKQFGTGIECPNCGAGVFGLTKWNTRHDHRNPLNCIHLDTDVGYCHRFANELPDPLEEDEHQKQFTPCPCASFENK